MKKKMKRIVNIEDYLSRQSAPDDDTLFPKESAEIAYMKKQYLAKQRVLKVKGALLPYIRENSKIVTYDKANGRYKIRIPLALRKDERDKVTANSEQEAYYKFYVYLFGDDMYTVRSMFERVIAQKKNDPDISSLTVDRYIQVWNKHYDKDPIADKPLADLKASYIKAFFKRLTGGRVMSRKAFNNLKSILNAVYDMAIELDVVTDNICRSLSCKDLKFKAVDNSNVRYTNADREAILAYLDGKSDKNGYDYGIELMFCLCIRIGELKALRWSDIDYRLRTITIAREVVLRKDESGKNRYVELDHTKGGEKGSRVLPLSERAIQVLKNLRERPVLSDHIVSTEKGNPLNTGHFNDHLKAITSTVGVPYMSSHKIRFWSVTELARATGGDLETVMYAAGHCDKNTTLHYIRAVRSDAQVDKILSCFG